MIVDFLLFVSSLVLAFIHGILSVITWAVPDTIILGVQNFLSHLGYLQGFMPIVADTDLSGMANDFGILNLIVSFVGVFVAIVSVRLILWLISVVPVFGSNLANSSRLLGRWFGVK